MSDPDKIGAKKTVDTVVDRHIDNLGSIDEAVRAKAVIALGKASPPEAIPPLEQTAEDDENIKLRYLARKQVEKIRLRAQEGPPRLDVLAPDRSRGTGSIDIERFCAGLRNSDPKARINTIKIAMALRDPNVVEPLVKHSSVEADPTVLAAVIQAVGLLGGKRHLRFIIAYLAPEHQASVRVASVIALGLVHEIIVYPYIVKAMVAKDAALSKAAYRELKKLGKTNLVNLLRNMLLAKQTWMRRAAVRACQLLGRSRRIRALLEERLQDADSQLVEMVTKALDNLSVKARPIEKAADPGLLASAPSLELEVDALAGMIRKMPVEERQSLLQNFVDNKDTDKVPNLVAWLKAEDDSRMTASLLIGLGRLADEAVVDDLAKYLNAADGRIRANAVEALGKIWERHGCERIPGLIKSCLKDRHNRVKANAVVALRGYEEAAETLEQMVYSGSPTYQRSAVYAIAVLRRQEHKPLVEFLVRAKDRMVQKQAQEVLDFFTDNNVVPKLGTSRELNISEHEVELIEARVSVGKSPGNGEGDDEEQSELLINPWDSTLLSEEDAAALLRKGAKKVKQQANDSAALDFVESIASTLILACSFLFFVSVFGIVAGLAWKLMQYLGEFEPSWLLIWLTGIPLIFAIEGLIPRNVDIPDGIRVGRRDAPQLYSLIDRIADQLRVAKPESVFIHPFSEIGIYEVTATPFIPWSGGRQLRLGLASLRALSSDQLKALLYSHFGILSTAKDQYYLRIICQMDAVLQQIQEKLGTYGDFRAYINPCFLFAMAFKYFFRLFTARTFRRMVLKADTLAARYSSRSVYSTALQKYCISSRLFDYDLPEIVQGASRHGQSAAENIYNYYRGFLDGLNEKRLLRLKREIFKYSPPGDRVFPDLQARLDTIGAGKVPEPARVEKDQAASLLVNREKIEKDFSARFIDLVGVSPNLTKVIDGSSSD